MIVIYAQDEAFIRENAEDAKSTLISTYGNKFGNEAYFLMKNAQVGTTYRKNGGPLVRCVNKNTADQIRKKEFEIGMLK